MIKSSRALGILSIAILAAACSNDTAEEQINRARDNLQQNKYQEAAIDLKNALRQQDSAEARWLLGNTYLQQKRYLDAEKELKAAWRDGWPTEQIMPELALSLLSLQKFVELRELNSAVLPPEPQGRVLAAKAEAELMQGELADAERAINKANDLARENPEVLLSSARVSATGGRLETALQEVEKSLQGNPARVPAWIFKGDLLRLRRDYSGAVEAYTEALALEPANEYPRLARTLIHIERAELDSAQKDVDTLIEISADSPSANFASGALLFARQEYEDAITALSQAEQLAAVHPTIYYYQAFSNAIEGNLDTAAINAQQFHVKKPENTTGRLLLATLRLKQGDFTEVAKLTEPLLNAQPDNIYALNLMANALMGLGQSDQAIAILAKIAKLQPDSSTAQLALGANLLATGAGDEAESHLQNALKLDPQYQQAEILLILKRVNEQEYDAAIEAAKSYAGRNPAAVSSHNLLGDIYEQAGQPEAAIASYNKSLVIDKSDPGANHALARIAEDNKDFDTARGHYEAILAVYPDMLPTLLFMARLESVEGNEEAMVERLRQANRLNSTAMEPKLLLGQYYLRKGRADMVAPLLDSLSVAQKQSPEVLQLLAQAQLAGSDHATAIKTLNQALDSMPATPETLLMVGRAKAATGDFPGAREALAEALALEEGHVRSRITLARLDLAENQPASFDRQLAVLVTLAPEDVDVLHLRAIQAYRSDDMDGAVEHARRGYQIIPSNSNLQNLVATMELGGRSGEAVNLLQHWVAAHPDETPIRLALAMKLGDMGEQAASEREYREVLKQTPESIFALNNLAWSLREVNPEEALKLAEKAAALAPTSAAILDTHAMLEYYNKHYANAETVINKALSIAPDSPTLLYHRALIENAAGRPDSAKRILRSLVDSKREFSEFQQASELLSTLSGQ
jgi:putative PEP-CTERM system TPR-repeat lipoprotein